MKNARKTKWMGAGLACLVAMGGCGPNNGNDEIDASVTRDGATADAPAIALDGGATDAPALELDGGACAGRSLCATEGSACDGETLVVCAADADGCLVEARADCAASGEACRVSAGAAACLPVFCPEAEARVLDCASGTVSGDTAMGGTHRGAYVGCSEYHPYGGREQIWAFHHDPSARMRVEILATRSASGDDDESDFDLYAFAPGASMSCTEEELVCRGASTGSELTETVRFTAEPGESTYLAYDAFGESGDDGEDVPTSTYTLTVTCTPAACGDGVRDSGEACDDGNAASGDGCSDACAVEDGYRCIGEGPGSCEASGTNGTCAAARDLGYAPITVRGNNDDGAIYTAGDECGGGAGKALWYTVTVPANTRAVVSVTPGDFDAVLRMHDSCDAGAACARLSDDGEEYGTETILARNDTAAPIQRVFAVLSYYASDTGDFELRVTHESIVPLAPADVTAVAPGLPMSIPDGDLTGIQADATVSSACTIQWVRVRVGINHAWAGDVHIRLRGPSGVETTLSQLDPSLGSDLVGTFVFQSSGAEWPGSGYSISDDPPYAADFSAFTGTNGAGTWSLLVADEGAIISGRLESFMLELGCE